jgi:hypothetical protein
MRKHNLVVTGAMAMFKISTQQNFPLLDDKQKNSMRQQNFD